MTSASRPPDRLPTVFGALFDRPYLLLSLTSLFWAGNAIFGRNAAGLIPPIALSFLRWSVAFMILLPFGWRHLRTDWPAIKARLGFMLVLSATGIGAFNTLQYSALEYTTALNVLLLQSSMPLIVALWSLLLLGVRLSVAQGIAITLSMAGVALILLKGDLAALGTIDLNRGDIIFTIALVVFGYYSTLSIRRPKIHPLSFLAFTFGCGALSVLPFLLWELHARPPLSINAVTLTTIAYVAIFPSILAYLCYNRGVLMVGPNRAAPFFHLVPVFGSAMAIAFLGERPGWYHIIGYAMVLTGVVVAARKPRTDTPEPISGH